MQKIRAFGLPMLFAFAAGLTAQDQVQWTQRGTQWYGVISQQGVTVWAGDLRSDGKHLIVTVKVDNQSDRYVMMSPDEAQLVRGTRTYASIPLRKLYERAGPSLATILAESAAGAAAGYENAAHPTQTETTDATIYYPNGSSRDVQIERQVPRQPTPAPRLARSNPEREAIIADYNRSLPQNVWQKQSVAPKYATTRWIFFPEPKRGPINLKIRIDDLTFEFPWDWDVK